MTKARAPTAPYFIAHACFSCRKSFKRPIKGDHRCPECRGPLHFMGRSFKVPAQTDTDQWRKVEALYREGFRFFSYRSFPNAPKLPSRYKEVAAFVRANPRHPFRTGVAQQGVPGDVAASRRRA
jgi:hypothetical protein